MGVGVVRPKHHEQLLEGLVPARAELLTHERREELPNLEVGVVYRVGVRVTVHEGDVG